MRLQSLELHGYKTFAARTRFVFDGGITAIVGPNGSGKSNIADAIRWVLGEQSYRSLRGKRTEDMIFSGSSQRARLGMASASLSLDNEAGWLPIDFSEVILTRRAYRSGENEYMINGHRVRLGDIVELLSKSGLAQRTYAVVGQGVVDAVLSLRPEDRRALFEEAAGIAVYRLKRTDSLARLEETRTNLLRVNDIVNEIGPHLRRLEREAERARLHGLLTAQLNGLLRTWYGFRWHEIQVDLQRARDAVGRREVALARRREALGELQELVSALRHRQAEVREQLGLWHRESGDLHGQMEEIQRDLAVWQERLRLLGGQSRELEHELAELLMRSRADSDQLRQAQEEVAHWESAVDGHEQSLQATQEELAADEQKRDELSRQMAEVQAGIFDLSAQAVDRRSRLEQVAERRRALGAEEEEHRGESAALEARLGQVRAEEEACAGEEARLREGAEGLQSKLAVLDDALSEGEARQAELRGRVNAAQLEAHRLEDRFELLDRLRQEGEGLQAGVRAVLHAARREAGADLRTGVPLAGIVGTVAQLIAVPPEYEIAMEVALGGHLQDIVVESWSNAEEAIAFLRRHEEGRATFLPLDTVRPATRLRAPAVPGVVGMGAELVSAEPRHAPIVEMLLARTLVVQDLPVARRAFDLLQGSFQIVTSSGELVRSNGSVTGGQGGAREPGRTLRREREWRELPAQVEEARRGCRDAETALSEARGEEQRLRARRAEASSAQAKQEKAAARAAALRQELAADAEHILEQIAWRQGLVAQVEREALELVAQESALLEDVERLASEVKAAEARGDALRAALDEVAGERLYRRVAEARTALAVARGHLEHRRTAAAGLEERLAQLQAQLEARRNRLAELEREQTALAEQIHGQVSRETVVRGWLEALAARIQPAEAEAAGLEAERERLATEEAAQRARLSQAESSNSHAVLALNREQDRRQRLKRQIMDDFGLVEMEPMDDLPDQPPLPLAEMVSALPAVQELPQGLEEDIHQLRAQIKRIGSFSANVLDEYNEVLQRHSFLTTQAADLEQAALRLRQIIAELDELMRREFQRTFDDVAARFEQNFTRLFDGGTAHLSLTDPDDFAATGVEIVARPPGKRQQTLALLSGGERALTAVSLVFALLQANPPPFCILDEVDAMLDEVNVHRFRAVLEELSQQTQFIVITHNRATIQAAGTIYGVSIGEDSVSQVVSLRLEGDRIVTAAGSEVKVEETGEGTG